MNMFSTNVIREPIVHVTKAIIYYVAWNYIYKNEICFLFCYFQITSPCSTFAHCDSPPSSTSHAYTTYSFR
jgi:hypothetical protein